MTDSIGQTLATLFLASIFASATAQPNPNNPPPLQSLGDAPEPTENPITQEKRVLGKILFWDEQLSSNNTVACGTCHQPAIGGADPRPALHPGFDQIFGTLDDVIGSLGIRALDASGRQINDPLFGHAPQVTRRATPSFFTSMFADSNFWDGQAGDEFVDPLDESSVVIATGAALENQAIGPILSTVEMAQAERSWQDVVTKLEQSIPLSLATNIPADMADALQGGASYPDLFAAAFSDSEITPSRIAMAIATYERTLVPNETPWDAYIDGDGTAMTASQIEGWQLFDQSACKDCHVPPLFSDNNFHNIGLRPSAEDLGQASITNRHTDNGKFKTPSLRNVGSRTSLMHLGWISDVSDAMDFYNAGTNATGHTQFTQDQSNIPNNDLTLNELDVFGDDPLQRNKIIDFITNGLSDPRAENEEFPFDRPTLASELSAQTPAVFLSGARSDAVSTSALFHGSVIAEGNQADSEFSITDVLAINVRIDPDSADLGQAAQLYCVVAYEGQYYALTQFNTFALWNGELTSLPSMDSRSALGSRENISVVAGLSQLPGTFDIFVGYTLDDEILRFNASPIHFTVN